METRVERKRSEKKKLGIMTVFACVIIAAGIVFGYICANAFN